MKNTKLYIALTLVVFLILSSCSVDNDIVTYRDVNITDYSSIEIGHGITAYITFSDTEESIELEANDYLHSAITATKRNDTLVIEYRGYDDIIKEKEMLNVYITTKSIDDFYVGGKVYLKNTLAEDIVSINLQVGSLFSGEVDVNNLDLDAYGSNVELLGSVNILNATLIDTKLSGYELQVEDLKMRMYHLCYANATVTKTIDIIASHGSTLSYKGNATIISEKLEHDSKVIKVE